MSQDLTPIQDFVIFFNAIALKQVWSTQRRKTPRGEMICLIAPNPKTYKNGFSAIEQNVFTQELFLIWCNCETSYIVTISMRVCLTY